jgi:hypothetical protein
VGLHAEVGLLAQNSKGARISALLLLLLLLCLHAA